jgi:hypothetical protein
MKAEATTILAWLQWGISLIETSTKRSQFWQPINHIKLQQQVWSCWTDLCDLTSHIGKWLAPQSPCKYYVLCIRTTGVGSQYHEPRETTKSVNITVHLGEFHLGNPMKLLGSLLQVQSDNGDIAFHQSRSMHPTPNTCMLIALPTSRTKY